MRDSIEKIKVPYGEKCRIMDITIRLGHYWQGQEHYIEVIEKVHRGCKNVEVLNVEFEGSKGRIRDLVFTRKEGDRGMFENLKNFSVKNIDVGSIKGLESLADKKGAEANGLNGRWNSKTKKWEITENK